MNKERLPKERMPWELTAMPDQATLQEFLRDLIQGSEAFQRSTIVYNPIKGIFEDIKEKVWEVK